MNRHTLAAFTLVEIMIVVTIIGLLAAMAVPAFNRIRTYSQDKAVINNCRQLAASAESYYMEHGQSTVSWNQVVGATNYVKAFNLVANETYPSGFSMGVPVTVLGVAGVRTLTYQP